MPSPPATCSKAPGSFCLHWFSVSLVYCSGFLFPLPQTVPFIALCTILIMSCLMCVFPICFTVWDVCSHKFGYVLSQMGWRFYSLIVTCLYRKFMRDLVCTYAGTCNSTYSNVFCLQYSNYSNCNSNVFCTSGLLWGSTYPLRPYILLWPPWNFSLGTCVVSMSHWTTAFWTFLKAQQADIVVVVEKLVESLQHALKRPWIGWAFHASHTNYSRGMSILLAKSVPWNLVGGVGTSGHTRFLACQHLWQFLYYCELRVSI